MLSSNIKYAVGIDFGHGVTSFGYYPITWGKGISAQEIPESPTISLANKDVSIPSIYLYDKTTQEMFIGDDAANYYNELEEDDDEFIYAVSFKKRIPEMDDNEKELFRLFMQKVKSLILQCKGELKDGKDGNEGNYAVFIARPSGWPAEEDDLYLELARKAGLPVVGIWPESRASMMRFISEASASTISNGTGLVLNDISKIHDGCVLMDIGSSTTDFSYINQDMNHPIDDNGNDCGGQIIDEILLQYILALPKNEMARKAVSESYNESWYNSLLYRIRKGKEDFFKGSKTIGFSIDTYYGDSIRVRCRATDCPNDIVYKLLKEGLNAFEITPTGRKYEDKYEVGYSTFIKNSIHKGFIPALHNELIKFISKHVTSKNANVSCFILSGGTAQLFKASGIDSFFKPSILSDESVDYSDLPVFIDDKPSTSVSNGLALTGRNYVLFNGCSNASDFTGEEKSKAHGLKQELENLVNRQLNEISTELLKCHISARITNKLMEEATETITCFAEPHEANPSLKDLRRDLNKALSSACDSSGEIISEVISGCLIENLNAVSGDIQKLVSSYTIQSVKIPSTEKYSSIKNLNIPLDIDNLIKKICNQITEQLIYAVLYLLLFPIISVVWVAIKTGFAIIGKSDEIVSYSEFFRNFMDGGNKVVDNVASRGRLRMERKTIKSKFMSQTDEFSYEIYEKLIKELSEIDIIVEDGIKASIEQYKNDAYKAIERVFK